MFPQSLGLSASFDTELVRRVGRAIGAEARSIGIHACLVSFFLLRRNKEEINHDPTYLGPLVSFDLASSMIRSLKISTNTFLCMKSPVLDIGQDPRWGRMQGTAINQGRYACYLAKLNRGMGRR